MSTRPRALVWAILAGFLLDASATVPAGAGPVYVEIVADQNRNSPDPLQPFDVRFILHANGNQVQGVVIAGQFQFSNGNFVGEIEEWPNGDAQLVYSPQSVAAFASRAWSSGYGNGSDPDTILIGLTSFGAPWKGTGELLRIHVVPTDTGTMEYDSLPGPVPPSSIGWISVMDPQAVALPVHVIHSPIHVPPQPGPVRFRFSTVANSDTLFQGSPARIFINVDAMGNKISGMTFALEWDFSNGSFIGPFSDVTGEVQYSPTALAAYESIAFNSFLAQGNDPDSSLLGMVDFDGESFNGSDWMWSVNFEPSDTGTVEVVPLQPPVWETVEAYDTVGGVLPSNIIPGRFVVLPCPYEMMGDVNQDAVITSSDLIYFINYVFKSGPQPLPDRSVGDVDCSGGLGGGDIIHMVNYIFKSGAAPCACIVRRI